METTQDLLDALRQRAGSDRKAAALLGVSQQSFSRWRQTDDYPSDDRALTIAERLDLAPALVLAIIHADRSKSEETRAVWRRIAAQFAKAAGLAVVAVAAGFGAPPAAQAGFNENIASSSAEYTLCPIRRRRKRQGSPFAAACAMIATATGLSSRRMA